MDLNYILYKFHPISVNINGSVRHISLYDLFLGPENRFQQHMCALFACLPYSWRHYIPW